MLIQKVTPFKRKKSKSISNLSLKKGTLKSRNNRNNVTLLKNDFDFSLYKGGSFQKLCLCYKTSLFFGGVTQNV